MADQTIFVVDDDAAVRDSLCALLMAAGYAPVGFESAIAFLQWIDSVAGRSGGSPGSCLIADIRMPVMDGLQLQAELNRRRLSLSVIIVTGHADVPLAVKAMKAGAIDFIEKPYDAGTLLESVRSALLVSDETRSQVTAVETAISRIATLTQRERQVLDLLVAGASNKVIAFELDISPRTVEIHRAHLMDKMQARGLSDLVRMAIVAQGSGAQSSGAT